MKLSQQIGYSAKPRLDVQSSMLGREFLSAILKAPPGSALARELAAGVTVFRIAEQMLREGTYDAGMAACVAIELGEMRNLKMRRRLLDLLELIHDCAGMTDGAHDVAKARLMAYGLELHEAAHYGPATEVFALVIDHFTDDPVLRMQAIRGKAFALRLGRRLDDSEVCYLELERLAVAAKDHATRLHARLGLAFVLIGRGEYPEAERIVSRVADMARRRGLSEILANALVTLAGIAGARHRPWDVVRYSDEARPLMVDQDCRERALVNMGYAWRELERPEVAHHLASLVLRSGRCSYLRHKARHLLYELAIDDLDWQAANELSLALMADFPTTENEAEFQHARSRHVARQLGDFEKATEAAREMLRLCDAHQLNELVFSAERAIEDLANGRVPAAYDYRPEGQPADAVQFGQMQSHLLELVHV